MCAKRSNCSLKCRMRIHEDQCHNQCVNTQRFDQSQTNQHVHLNFTGCFRISGNTAHCTVQTQALPDTTAKCSNTDCQTCRPYTTYKKFHF